MTMLLGYLQGLGGLLVGFALGLIPPWIERKRKRKAHWAALAAELQICEERARTYTAPGAPSAPLYRFPVSAFTGSLPALIAEGGVRAEEVKDLVRFSGWVQDINRGLDNADKAWQSPEQDHLALETNRLHLKCRELLEGHGADAPLLTKAKRIIERRIRI